jgi:hypothetical protein
MAKNTKKATPKPGKSDLPNDKTVKLNMSFEKAVNTPLPKKEKKENKKKITSGDTENYLESDDMELGGEG